MRNLLCLLAAALLGHSVAAQTAPRPAATPPRDTGTGSPVIIDYAEVFDYIVTDTAAIQRLSGEVELRQDSAFIYADTASIFDDTYVEARGNVVLRQNDTLSVFADSLDYYADRELAYLYGNVVLVNGGQQLFTDSLRYDLRLRRATYTSRAKLTDSTSQLSSLRGSYDVEAGYATFRDSVFVVADDFNLIADTLGFDTETRVVYFEGPTSMATPNSRVYTEDGSYSLVDTVGQFARNAQVRRGTQVATADTIDYDGPAGLFTLTGRARFADGAQRARAEQIVYDEAANRTRLTGDAVFVDGEQRVTGERIDYDGASRTFNTAGGVRISEPPFLLTADSLWYDETGGIAHVEGDVLWRDTASRRSIVAERVDYRSAGDYVKAYGGRPLFATVVETDTLFLAADTLLTFLRATAEPLDTAASLADSSGYTPDSTLVALSGPSDTTASLDTLAYVDAGLSNGLSDSLQSPRDTLADNAITSPPASNPTTQQPNNPTILPDSVRMLLAYPEVRIFKSDLQAIADSLAYDGLDSAFVLFGAPIMWSDTSQFAGDTIAIRMRNDLVDRVELRSNAMIVNSPDELFFNQVKGRRVDVTFTGGAIDRMLVNGNAESVYYVLDDAAAYVGVNHVKAARMRMAFANGELSDIYFYDQPAGDLAPLAPRGQEPKLLDDFRWETDLRPASRDDLL